MITMQNLVTASHTFTRIKRSKKKFEDAGAPPLRMRCGGWRPVKNTPLPYVCYCAELGHFRLNRTRA